ncbi:MAG TPA: hypothetical protein VNK41_09195 [Vicinamibacterales bacterium]|nr:hypothetical protein [Vicinamibacterales bacterium]
MRILFLARRFLYFRNYDDVIRELAGRGHRVHLAAERGDIEGRPPLVDELATLPNVTVGHAPSRADDDWRWMADRLRLGLDYLRYQHPLFDEAPKLRLRARERTPRLFVALGDPIGRHAPWMRKPAAAMLRHLERAVPDDPGVARYIDEQRPDVLILTPLIDLGSAQIDYLRATRARRIPTILAVWSWDHLSSKALVRECPDRVLVWNEVQKREAIELHGVPAERIVVTGAQCFDRWFGRQPSRDRETFCAAVGLPSNRPLLLWVCSALFLGSRPEAPVVLEWLRRIRASAVPGLHDAAVLIRPHPSRTSEWQGVDLTGLGPVAVHGSSPVDAASRADYFDALYHSAAIIGINTSAFIEGGIVGRPVHTILLPELHENQMGTLHFRYLLDYGGGLLEAARDFDEHVRQLARSLAQPPSGIRPFVKLFVRPYGLDVAATPRFVEAVEQMTHAAVAAPPRRWKVSFARWLLGAMIAWRSTPAAERWFHSERELEAMARIRRAREHKEERAAQRQAAEAALKQAKRARRELEWIQHRAARAARDAENKKVLGRVP